MARIYHSHQQRASRARFEFPAVSKRGLKTRSEVSP
jgi:hypothetical protein